MAQNKNQHFVPKCHLKPFSLNRGGNCISLYNIAHNRIIHKAAVSDQCSKDYFYGEDGQIETALQDLEGQYAEAVRSVDTKGGYIEAADIEVLRAFAFLQYVRTEKAVKRAAQAQQKLADVAFGKGESQPNKPPPIGKREILQMVMSVLSENGTMLDDLKVLIVLNRTSIEFITSDDPCIHTNRYYIQKLGRSNFGISNAGAILILPLTPVYTFILYDGGCYTVPDKSGCVVSTDKSYDVASLNEWQVLNCDRNLYFSSADMGEVTKKIYEEKSSNRIDDWTDVEELFKVGENLFGAAPAGAEKPRESVIHSAVKNPSPSQWPSFLKYRSPVRVVDTGTGAGVMRRGYQPSV